MAVIYYIISNNHRTQYISTIIVVKINEIQCNVTKFTEYKTRILVIKCFSRK